MSEENQGVDSAPRWREAGTWLASSIVVLLIAVVGLGAQSLLTWRFLDMERDKAAWRERLGGITNAIAEKGAELTEVQTLLAEAAPRAEEASTQLIEVQGKLSAQRESYDDVRRDKERAEADLEQANARIATLADKYDTGAKAYAALLKKHKAETRAAEQQLEQARTDVASTRAELARLKDVEQGLATQQAMLKMLEGEVAKADAARGEAVQAKAIAEAQSEAVKGGLTDARAQHAGVLAALNAAQANAKAALQAEDAARQRAEEARTELATVRQEIEWQKAKLAEVEALDEAVAGKRKVSETLTQQVANLRAEVAALLEQVRLHRQQLSVPAQASDAEAPEAGEMPEIGAQ